MHIVNHSATEGVDRTGRKKATRIIMFSVLGIALIGTSYYTGYLYGSRSVIAPVQKVDVSVNDDASLGNIDAPVIIIEFSDYECPYCRRHANLTLPLIKKNFIDTGKVRYVFRDFPLGIHPNALKAAEAAECAGEQGKYWKMHDILFDKQDALRIENYKIWAAELALDQVAFEACLDSGSMAPEVQQDLKDGQTIGITGTPLFFVNGKPISGAQPYSVFKTAINAALAK